MITKDFEEYFPLTWKMHRCGEGDNIITASGEPLCYIKCGKTEQNRNACQYLVRCANLMPEAVEVLDEADDHMGALLAAVCDDCPKLGTEDCEECPPYTTLRKIGVLLAKLEGGAEE